MDYGAPIGFRLATRHPERVTALIVQNGNAYVEGLREFWDPFRQYWQDNSPASRELLRGFLRIDATIFQYTLKFTKFNVALASHNALPSE